MAKLFANSGDPDQTPRSAASDLGLHCLPSTLLHVSRLQWVKSAGRVANSVDPDHMLGSAVPDLGLHCFLRLICPI